MDPAELLYAPMILLNNRQQEYNFCLKNSILTNFNYLEFGVWEGNSINHMASSKYFPKNKIFHGFDTFVGLPDEWDMGHQIIKKGHFKVKEMPKVKSNVRLYKGLFKETLPEWKQKYNEPVCFMNIDCDLYSSTKQVLCILNELIVKDTLIRFDDFFDSPINPYSKWLEGQWRALNEWTQEFNRVILPIARSWKNGCTIKVLK